MFLGFEKNVQNISPGVIYVCVCDCISHCTNTYWKGVNPIILPPAMGK